MISWLEIFLKLEEDTKDEWREHNYEYGKDICLIFKDCMLTPIDVLRVGSILYSNCP